MAEWYIVRRWQCSKDGIARKRCVCLIVRHVRYAVTSEGALLGCFRASCVLARVRALRLSSVRDTEDVTRWTTFHYEH